jgi:oxaloacetate decarboxylase gamma subunit
METNLVMESFKFMILGMGTVFVFLGIMIFFMDVMSKFIHKFFPEIKPDVNSALRETKSNEDNQKKVVAAITAAIKYHREGQK